MNILPSIEELLVAGGIDTDIIKYVQLTDGRSLQVAIRDTGEIEPDINDTASVDIEHRTFQILTRSDDYDQLAGINTLIRRALHERIGVTTEAGHHFYMIGTLSGLQPITNEIGNYEFSGNFECRVREENA